MAVQVFEDVIDSSQYTDDKDGQKINRVFIVDGLTVGNKTNRPLFAVLQPGIPPINSYHPSIPFLQVKDRQVQPINKDSEQFRVICNYERLNTDDKDGTTEDEPAQISVGTQIITARTTRAYDSAGQPIQMILTPRIGTAGEGKALPPQSIPADIQKALFFARFTRRELEPPDQKAVKYANKINSVPFLGRSGKEVYCSGINGNSTDGGITYTVNYEFLVDPDGWDYEAIYTDTDGNILPTASEQDGTLRKFQVYERVDFNQLGLT
jgi:hypothetical protein